MTTVIVLRSARLFSKLTHLDLSNKKISEVLPLASLEHDLVSGGKVLDLSGNYLDDVDDLIPLYENDSVWREIKFKGQRNGNPLWCPSRSRWKCDNHPDMAETGLIEYALGAKSIDRLPYDIIVTFGDWCMAAAYALIVRELHRTVNAMLDQSPATT